MVARPNGRGQMRQDVEVEGEIRAFLGKNFPLYKEDNVGREESLVESGVIDSLGILELVDFVEETFALRIPEDELLPERESARDTGALARLAADSVGVETVEEDITNVLEALGCYRRRDEAFRKLIPEYGPGWKAKIVLPPILGSDSLRLFSVVARSPDGEDVRDRVTADTYREIVASTNFKQRTRKMLEYYYADRFEYAVAGTPNRLEYDLGFF